MCCKQFRCIGERRHLKAVDWWRLCTPMLVQMFINFCCEGSICAKCTAVMWTCQILTGVLQGRHVTGFSCILTFKRVCVFQCQSPRCCLFIMCTWFCVHLRLWAQNHLAKLITFHFFLAAAVASVKRVVPKKGQSVLCNRTKRRCSPSWS